MKAIIEKLYKNGSASPEELLLVLNNTDESLDGELFRAADKKRREIYGTAVFLRGLIEFTNHCRNNCLYCGIRAENRCAERFRLTREDILSCCENGYRLGFRTFVLQGGEDMYYTDDFYCDLIREIKGIYPDCAVTLSIGERPRESYQRYYDSGADRYLLRHETADEAHYSMLHPESMSFSRRMECLKNLKEIGFQTGAGLMVGSPYQTKEHLVKDLLFLKEFKPQMVGIGPFIPHCETPFRDKPQGALRDSLVMVALTRLLLPKALIPATTALGTIHPEGREMGLKAGANVVMPNLSPLATRKLYDLYDNKICTGEEAAECRDCLEERVKSAGYEINSARGDAVI